MADLLSWGAGGDGLNGVGSTVDLTTPALISSGWAAVSSVASHTLAVKSNGTLWAWGVNDYGQFGNGVATGNYSIKQTTPVQVGVASDWAKVATGRFTSYAIKTSGALFGWGGVGAVLAVLGDGTTNGSYLPVQIPGTWNEVTACDGITAAIKADGTLWGFGDNRNGQLGTGVGLGTFRLTLVQEGTLATDWVAVYSTLSNLFAMKLNGTVCLAGYLNTDGANRAGTTSTFVPIGIAGPWAKFSVGASDGTFGGIKADGTMWTWGQFRGDGTVGYRALAAKIGVDTDWASVSWGADHRGAIKTNNALYMWGPNFNGPVGDGTTVDATTPRLILAVSSGISLRQYGTYALGPVLLPPFWRDLIGAQEVL